MRRFALVCLALLTVFHAPTYAGDAVVPGELVIEPATLNCVSFRWYVAGDDNRNATVGVSYGAQGEDAFRTGLPMLRIRGETAFQTEPDSRWEAPNMVAGSLLDLRPGTQYEVRLRLEDPDGGGTEKRFSARTRAEPAAPRDGRTLHVYPSGHQGAKSSPACTGIRAAYAQARPGDVILMHAGVYTVPEAEKQDNTDYVFDKQATPERPIVLRAAGDGEAVLDGQGALKLIDCQHVRHHHFEGLSFRKADHVLYAGRAEGSVGLVVRRCRFTQSAYPIFALHPACREFYIADNTLEGPHPDWHPRQGKHNDSHAIWIQGQGHVICHNRIHGYWDGIDLYGKTVPADRALQNCAIDICNNEISACVDDGIELDYGMHNIRALRNFIYNTFMGISAQPVYAGPAYICRNVVYNCTRSPLKPNQYPAGLLVFHNTFLAAGSAGTSAPIWQNSQILNNVFVGCQGEFVVSTGTLTPKTSRMDYNGWRIFETKAKDRILWKPPTPVTIRGKTKREISFRDLSEFSRYTGYEQHHVLVDYDSFIAAAPPSGGNEPLPRLDLRLRPGKAVERGAGAAQHQRRLHRQRARFGGL